MEHTIAEFPRDDVRKGLAAVIDGVRGWTKEGVAA